MCILWMVRGVGVADGRGEGRQGKGGVEVGRGWCGDKEMEVWR